MNGRMEHATVRNNKDSISISKFEKQEETSDPLEQSDIKSIQNREEQMENQIIEGYETEESVNTSKKEAHKELKEDAASEEELRKKSREQH